MFVSPNPFNSGLSQMRADTHRLPAPQPSQTSDRCSAADSELAASSPMSIKLCIDHDRRRLPDRREEADHTKVRHELVVARRLHW